MHIYLAIPQNETRAKRARSGFLSSVSAYKRSKYPSALSCESRLETVVQYLVAHRIGATHDNFILLLPRCLNKLNFVNLDDTVHTY